MTTTDTTDASGEPLRGPVANYGARPAPEKIPEGLEPYLQQVRAMDPIRDVGGNVKITGSAPAPMTLKIESLSPDMQSEVRRKLELLPSMSAQDRAKHESKLVEEAVRSRLGGVRAMAGVHSDALPRFKEMAEIAGQVNGLQRKRDILQAAIDDIADVRPSKDQATGEVIAIPVYRHGEERRQAYAQQVADINRQIRLLVLDDGSFGIEGAKRMQKADIESAVQLKRLQEHRTVEAEAKKRAEAQLLEDRIAARAAQINRLRPSDA